MRFLYRSRMAAVIAMAAIFLSTAPEAHAQRPQLKRPSEDNADKPPIPPPPKKKVKGPRAVGILQTAANGKSTLVPVAILVDGHFFDASEYKADPVPIALDSGTVYEVEQTGTSEGLFTVGSALHSRNPSAVHPWIGSGAYLANGSEAASNFRKAEDKPVGIDGGVGGGSDDGPPRLKKSADSPAPEGTPASPTGTASSKAPSPADKPSGTASADKPSGTADKSPRSTPSTTAGNDTKAPSPAPETAPATQPPPGQTASGDSKPAQADQAPDSNFYRPTLRRSKPVASSAPPDQEDEPPVKSAKADSKTSTNNAVPIRQVPAISDDGGPNPRSFKFFWKPGEEDERRAQVQALAETEVMAYISAEAKNRIAAKPVVTKTTAQKRSAAKPVKPVFDDIHFQGFDVWLNNQPVMVFTGEAHLPPSAGSDAAPETYSITLVAKTDIYGDLHKLYSGVTDKFHLDVTPRLSLIDAVDADGDGRGELLFSETTDGSSGYIIYRATSDKLWKMFDSLGGS